MTEQGKEPEVIKCDGADGYSLEIEYVLNCALTNQAPTVVTAQDGFTALQICETEEKSVQTGQVVSL